MKRSIRDLRSGLVILTAVMMLCGCGRENVAATVPAKPDFSEKPGQEAAFSHSHPVGTTVRYDLNGDGIGENITVKSQEYDEGTLTVGDAELVFDAISPTGYFTILNVNQYDDDLLIGISDYGFSDDPVTVLYAYDGANLTEVGWFYDITGINEWGYAGAVFHGDGTFTAKRRWDVLGSWNTVGLYEVSENGIADITEFYPFIDWDGNLSTWEVKTKVDIITYERSDFESNIVTVPAGTVMNMVGLKKGPHEEAFWVSFEVEAMDELWVIVEKIDWESFVHTGIGFASSEQAFEGFFYAG